MIRSSEEVIFFGSGKSSLEAGDKDLTNYTIACANNAWRLFMNKSFDIWIHSGDFPIENYPVNCEYKQKISHRDYEKTSAQAMTELKFSSKWLPVQYIGETIFLQGLYWLMFSLRPKKIGLLGFDHDYNPHKIKKWNDNNRPNIQNRFNRTDVKNINSWSNEFFSDLSPDTFYGHGLPDPLRLGEIHLTEKFELAKKAAKLLDIKIVNYSSSPSKLNTFPRDILI